MFNISEKIFAGVLLIVCAVVGIVGYSFSRPASPPSKVWFDASGGDVIFDHAYHTGFSECRDCHHNFGEEDNARDGENNCRACHYYGDAREMESGDSTHPRFVGANCVECHESMDMEVGCDDCHIRPGMAFEASGRVMSSVPDSVKFETDAGVVLFDHKVHISKDVGEPCMTCHHDCKEMKGMACTKNCRACHYEQADKIPESDNENHGRHIGANCANCHDGDDCSQCHED